MTYVVPIPAPRLERFLREAKGALPFAGTLTSEGKLALVAIPCADEMDGLGFGDSIEAEG